MSGPISLDALRMFDSAARHLSFKLAAEEQGVTPTAVSHRIAALEKQIGVSLFDRGTRQIALNADGAALHLATRRAFPILEEAIERIERRTIRSAAIISVTSAFAAHWLIPRIDRFAQRFPGHGLSIRAGETLANLAAGEADIAIRYGGDAGGPNGTVLGRDRFVALASPLYWQAVGEKRSALRLLRFDWHRSDHAAPDWAAFNAQERLFETMPASLHFSDESSAFAALLSGQGVMLGSDRLAASYLRDGSLIRAFDGALPGFYYRLVSADRLSPAARAAQQWLIEEWNSQPEPAATQIGNAGEL